MIGFMGAGKTSAGRLVARSLGREFVDTDSLVERAARAEIAGIFRREGEEGFRRREIGAIDFAISTPGRVVAVGGGAVLSAENRTALKQAGFLVYLRATPETLAARLAGVTDRPLLANTSDRVGRIRDLLVARGPIYETAGDVAIDVDRLTVEQTANEVLESYQVHVGRGLLDRLGALLPPLPGAAVAAVVHPAAVAPVAVRVGRALAGRGLDVHLLEVPDGDRAKRLAVVEALWRGLAAVPAHRPDPVVAVGGGATTDVAGFAAATWLRGVPLVSVPTTLLGMVDAAVGGKTGVDLEAGKNLVGAFHQPSAVVADLDTLATLPAVELRSGMAEVIKAGLVADPDLAAACLERAAPAVAGDLDALAPLV